VNERNDIVVDGFKIRVVISDIHILVMTHCVSGSFARIDVLANSEYPRLRIGVQDRQQTSIPSWNDADQRAAK
jgi:hypothetical protein